MTEAAVAWLQAPERQSQPFAAFLSFVSPHYPLIAPRPHWDAVDPADVPPPLSGAPPAHPETAQLAGFFDYQKHLDAERAAEARRAYFALVGFLDACKGAALAALDASGLAERTLVLSISDHGEMLGDLGLWTKQSFHGGSVGVPMILAGPGVRPGRRVTTAVSLLDVAPTVRAAAGLPVDPSLPGDDLRALAAAADDPARGVFSEYHDGGSSQGGFMVRWDRWKYVAYARARPQLFDLDADPAERIDRLADKPDAEARAAAAEGAARLAAICDPAEVDARAFRDQAHRIEALGGEAALRARPVFGATPTPG